MPRKISSIIVLLFLLSLAIFPAYAETIDPAQTKTSSNLPNQSPLDFLGQRHYYSVTFRGNGETIVTGKMVFANNTNLPLTSYSFKLPAEVSIRDLVIFQQEKQGACLEFGQPSLPEPVKFNDSCTRYKTLNECDTAQKAEGVQCSWYMCVSKCLTTGTPVDVVCANVIQPTCLLFRQPDSSDAYLSGTSDYVKLDYELQGNMVNVKLDPYMPIQPNYYGSLVFYLRAKGFAKKNIFGAYEYTLRTFQINDKIFNLQVGITTDSDLILKDARGKINYQFNEAIASMGAPGKVGKEANLQLNNYYDQIGQGDLTKTASNLQADESYTVKGMYADLNLKLYGKEIVSVVLLLIFLATLIYGGIRLGHKYHVKLRPQLYINIIEVVGVTFASSLVFIVCILFYIVVTGFSLKSLGGSSSIQIIIIVLNLFLGLLLFIVEIICLVAPTIYFWRKKGAVWGIAAILMTIMWFAFYLVVLSLIFFPRFPTPPFSPTPMSLSK